LNASIVLILSKKKSLAKHKLLQVVETNDYIGGSN